MICKNCNRKTIAQKTIIRDGKIFDGCDACLSESKQTANPLNGNHSRNAQRAEYRSDLVQPVQSRDYARLHPEQAVERFGEDNARRFS